MHHDQLQVIFSQSQALLEQQHDLGREILELFCQTSNMSVLPDSFQSLYTSPAVWPEKRQLRQAQTLQDLVRTHLLVPPKLYKFVQAPP